LILLLAERLHFEGFDWVVFTAAAGLCNSFSKMRLPLTVIAPAAAERLESVEREQWGRYYDRSSSVMLGDIPGGRRQLQSRARAADRTGTRSARRGLLKP
jgi:hypothetical protein